MEQVIHLYAFIGNHCHRTLTFTLTRIRTHVSTLYMHFECMFWFLIAIRRQRIKIDYTIDAHNGKCDCNCMAIEVNYKRINLSHKITQPNGCFYE